MKCSFCKKEVEPGTGSMQALKSGKVLHFCSNKCRKNHGLGRNPKKVKWVVKKKKVKTE